MVERVTNGMGAMPPFEGVLTEQQITEVAKYVSSVAGNVVAAAATDLGARPSSPRRAQLRKSRACAKAEREGFEPSTHLLGTHAISSRAPSANSDTSPRAFRVPPIAKEGGRGNHGFPHKEEAPPTMSTRASGDRALGRAEPRPLGPGGGRPEAMVPRNTPLAERAGLAAPEGLVLSGTI